MLEPPSKDLLVLFRDLRICALRDIKRCRPRVRRLAHDLPAFDSVWIDALVQARKVTSFQAKFLESDQARRLKVGPCLILKLLGNSESAATFLARRIATKERCVLKQSTIPLEAQNSIAQRMSKLTRLGRSLAHPQVVIPHAFNWIANKERLVLPSNDAPNPSAGETDVCLVSISRNVTGISLAELLVRRGRLRPEIVEAIGKQLIAGLAVLEKHELAHGSISLSNVLITPTGFAVMVDAGLKTAMHSEFSRFQARNPDRYDGIAPELIGTGRAPSLSSDIYAVGCLLWQLLAGRPPYPTGDPLAKLAAHQTRRVGDVRQWAPDTPETLASAIIAFTQPDSKVRPASPQQILERWGSPGQVSKHRLRRFYATFQVSAPKAPRQPSSAARITKLTAGILIMASVTWGLFDQGARATLLNLRSKLASDTTNVDAGQPRLEQHNQEPRLREIPSPDAYGIIRLEAGKKYAASELTAVGTLIILTDGPSPAEVIVSNQQTLKILATKVRISNVTVRSKDKTAHAFVQIRARQTQLDRCRFELSSQLRQTSSNAFVEWTTAGESAAADRVVRVKDTCFVGHRPAISLASTANDVQVENCLKLGGGAMIQLAQPPAKGNQTQLAIEHVTLRRAGALLELIQLDVPLGYLFVRLDSSVLDLLKREPLIRIVGDKAPVEWTWLRIEGEGSVATQTFEAARYQRFKSQQSWPLELPELGGIAAAPFKYAGKASAWPIDSEVKDYQTVGRLNPNQSANAAPGINASKMIHPQTTKETTPAAIISRPDES